MQYYVVERCRSLSLPSFLSTSRARAITINKYVGPLLMAIIRQQQQQWQAHELSANEFSLPVTQIALASRTHFIKKIHHVDQRQSRAE